MDDATKATKDFLKIKAKRTKRFLQAYDKIEEALKTIYTDMTKSSKHPLGGNAYLSLDDTEEPYKGGLKFNAMPPMKRFRDMEQVRSRTSHAVMYLTYLRSIANYVGISSLAVEKKRSQLCLSSLLFTVSTPRHFLSWTKLMQHWTTSIYARFATIFNNVVRRTSSAS